MRNWTLTCKAAGYASLAGLMSMGVGSALAVGGYTPTLINPVPGGTFCQVFGVNDAGVVVGWSDNFNAQQVAFVWTNGVSEELPLLAGGSEAQAWSVNNSNVIVGECKDASNVSRAVKWQKVNGVWTITDLGTLKPDGSGFGVAMRINDSGVVLGYSTSAAYAAYHATVWDAAGVASDVGTLSYTGPLAYSQGLALSNTGHVGGYAYRVLGGPEHGLVRIFGSRGAEDITPPGQFSLAQWMGVNDAATFVGYIGGPTTGGAWTPAKYVPGEGITTFPLLEGLPEGYAFDVNNGGVVVGTNFLLNPIPDPNVFRAVAYVNGVAIDLTAASGGSFGPLIEARDVSETGLIAANLESGLALLLTPMPETPRGCQPADIACDDGLPLSAGCTNGGVNEGDYNCFFAAEGFFFQASQGGGGVGTVCDIACDDGTALSEAPGCTNNGVNEGDYNCFFNNLFLGCPN